MWTNVLFIFKVIYLFTVWIKTPLECLLLVSQFFFFLLSSVHEGMIKLYIRFLQYSIFFLRYLNNCLDIHVQCFRKLFYVGTDKTTLWLVPSIICIKTHLARKSRIHPYFKKVWIPCVCCVYSNGTALIIQWEISKKIFKEDNQIMFHLIVNGWI